LSGGYEDQRWEAEDGDRAGAGFLRVASSPLLMGCLNALADGPRTQAELAEQLGWPPAKVNYAVTTLQRLGWATNSSDDDE